MIAGIRALLFYLGYCIATLVWGSVSVLVGWALPFRMRFGFIIGFWTRLVLGWLRFTCGIRAEVLRPVRSGRLCIPPVLTSQVERAS